MNARKTHRQRTHYGLGLAVLIAASLSPTPPTNAQPAFPGAEGYGAEITTGGRGGVVMIVSRLDDDASNPSIGSLRHAVEQTFPRTIVFAVSGYITLEKPLVISGGHGNVTIAGQTAPGDGITLRGAGLTINDDAANVIIRHIRIRHGSHDGFIDEECHPPGDKSKCESDAVQIDHAERVVIDHVSASWSIDELLTVSESENIIVQWSSFVEPLHNSKRHPENYSDKQGHGRGPLIRGADRVSFHHNIIAHAQSRSPQVSAKGGSLETNVLVQNNVIYAPVEAVSKFNYSGSDNEEDRRVMYVGNHYRDNHNEPPYETRKRGISNFETIKEPVKLGSDGCKFEGLFYSEKRGNNDPWIELYLSGNYAEGPWRFADRGLLNLANPWDWGLYDTPWNSGDDFCGAKESKVRVNSPPLPQPTIPITSHSASQARDRVLGFAGAQAPNLDSVDERVYFGVNSQYATATGRLIDDEDDVGGYPSLSATSVPLDSDGDGLPDGWELAEGYGAMGLLPGADNDSNGYPAIDDYINELGANCAAGKFAQQTWSIPVAGQAVDNNVTLDDPSTAAWTGTLPYALWEVHLDHPQDIRGLKVYKSDDQASYFENIYIEVHLNGSIVHTEGPFTDTVHVSHYIKFAQPVEGDLVRLSRQATNGYLGMRLAEVQVFCGAWPRFGAFTGPGPGVDL